jgi:phenylacetate-CoA ligase
MALTAAGELHTHSAMATTYFIPEEERLSRDALRALQLDKFRRMAEAARDNPFYRARFAAAGVDATAVRSMEDFRLLPFTTKAELCADQAAHPPYGSVLTYPAERYYRIHQTSGTTGTPLRWLDTRESWNWILRCWGIVYRAAGLTPADRLFFPFSFGPFLGFWAAFDGAQALGNMCMAGGGMSTVARLHFLLQHRATFVCCTPTYALRLAQTAAEEGIDLAGGDVRALVVAGEPGGSVPAVRRRIEAGWGARVFDHTGMTEIGSLGIECVEDPGNTHLIESECIAEVVDPATGDPLAPGTRGELVLTNLGRWGSPLIRYRTGDLVELTELPCACGRGYCRMLGGILGRSDDMFFVKGNNVYPAAIENIVREFDGVVEFRLRVREVGGMQELAVDIEPDPAREPDAAGLAARVADRIHNRLNFKPRVTPVAPEALPRFEMKARRLVME